ncbi:sulfatase-like hydrolase/transferase [bacterium]|nr:sulfatase-like hydrolase/transferase [bacterium]
MKKSTVPLFITLIIGLLQPVWAQKSQTPKLVVGIVVDQMRWDYLERYKEHYGRYGLMRLMREGSSFDQCHYPFVPTYTAPGHASIHTGSVPYYHGIIGNDWYERDEHRTVYCVDDTAYATVGADNDSGAKSPYRMRTLTLADQMKLAYNNRGQSCAVSIKDRGAILPGGHKGDAVFWYDDRSGGFVTSTYYAESLPEWVRAYNQTDPAVRLMQSDWTLLKPLEAYVNSAPDAGPGEQDVFDKGSVEFPYSFSAKTEAQKRSLIRWTPAGNTLLTDFALELVQARQLGQGSAPDFLSISYSSPDYIGHAYGPNSVEIMDHYLRFDLEMARLLKALDAHCGKDGYVVFLTADHGVKPNGALLEQWRMPSGTLRPKTVLDSLRAFCGRTFGNPDLIETVEDNQVYFNTSALEKAKIGTRTLEAGVVDYLRPRFPQMLGIAGRSALEARIPGRDMGSFPVNGHHPHRSGDVFFELAVNYLAGSTQRGTTHGASFDYDTHVPLIFKGPGIPKNQRFSEEVYIVDIAPTLAYWLGIQEPDGCIGRVILDREQR